MDKLDKLVLKSLPHFIAIEYQKLLDSDAIEWKVRYAVRVYKLCLRTLTMGVVSQYLIRDSARVNNRALNQLLIVNLKVAEIGTWQKIFFTCLKSYQGLRSLFFMPELHDFYWDSSLPTPRPRTDIEKPFTRLTQISNDVDNNKIIDWQAAYTEALTLLREILDHFIFFQNYDLIRITKHDADQYWYECHKGLEVDLTQSPFKSDQDLIVGRFYISRKYQDFLSLHPLLIFWEDFEPNSLATSERQQVAVYESFNSDQLRYLLTSLWESRPDDKSVADFVSLIFYTLQQIKQEPVSAERLTWEQLVSMAHTISRLRMASALEKYDPSLYLKRDSTVSAFDDFLASDKVCFVLTGKSGVGKSNFILALADEYERTRPEVGLLMYNGATLTVEQPLTVAIGQDFDNHLRLIGPDKPDHIANIWQEIAAIDNMTGKQVILFIDAINENPKANALLRQVNELVERSPWPWLKVVITSRPEAWHTITRGVKLARSRYYSAADEDELGFEMQGFSYSQQLESFTRDELSHAYTKYQAVYHMQTTFSDLSTDVKASLQDPLVLRLVAVTYHDQVIPATIKIGQIYQNYIRQLIASDRLAQEDVRFLEQELLPLMLHKDHYDNVLTSQQISTARTTDNRSLSQLIHDDGTFSSGQRVNQSYVNLVDAEILVRHDIDWDYEIGFKYERFYEHFAARQICRLVGDAAKILPVYRELTEKVDEYPFLWGAVVGAFVAELEKANAGFIFELSQTPSHTAKDLIVAALRQYGQDNRSSVTEILRRLLAADEDIPKKIAIEVASDLSIREILQAAATNESPGIRAVAIRNIFYVSRHSPQDSLAVLEWLAERVKSRMGLPNKVIVESCLGVSLLLYLNYPDNPSIPHRLQAIWVGIFDQLLPFGTSRVGRLASAVERLQSALFSLAVGVIVRVGSMLEESHAMVFSIKELALFFGDKQARETNGHLIPYLDVRHGSIIDIQEILVHAAQENDQWTLYLITAIFASRLTSERDAALLVARAYFDSCMLTQPATSHIAALLLAMSIAVTSSVDGSENELWRNYEAFITQFYQRSHNMCAGKRQIYCWVEQSRYLFFFYRHHGHTDSALVREFLENIEKREDWKLLKGYISGMAEHTARFGFKGPLLEGVLPFLAHQNEEIKDSAIDALARIGTYYRREMDEFLDDHDVDRTVQQTVRVRETAESFGHLLVRSGHQFLWPRVTTHPDQAIIEQLLWVFSCAVHDNSLERWFSDTGKHMLNQIHGRRIFKLS